MIFMRHTNSNEINVEIKGIDIIVTANTKNIEWVWEENVR